MDTKDDKSALTAKDVAEILNVTPRRVTQWIAAGELRAVRVDVQGLTPKAFRYRIAPADLAEFIRMRTT